MVMAKYELEVKTGRVSSRLGDHLWVDGLHVVDAVLVHHDDPEVGEVEDKPLLDLLDTLDHEGVGLLPGHVLAEVPGERQMSREQRAESREQHGDIYRLPSRNACTGGF